jgi:hypothetical protein
MGKVKYHQYTQDHLLAYLKAYDESGQSVRAFLHGYFHNFP